MKARTFEDGWSRNDWAEVIEPIAKYLISEIGLKDITAKQVIQIVESAIQEAEIIRILALVDHLRGQNIKTPLEYYESR